jgi:mannose-6-phosphate isomerase-like protein (cupin superfamily)
MKLFLIGIGAASVLFGEGPAVHSHEDLPEFSMYGNSYKGLSTKELGAEEFEIWRSQIAVGSRTPLHVHETEEVFLLLKGEILAVVGDREFHCKAPATLICPANVPHQLFNVGTVATEQIVVLGIDSKICDEKGAEMNPPWRR